MNLHLLIIEDEKPIIDSWEEKLAFYDIEDKKVYSIIPTYVSELSQAKAVLSNRFFDAAVIDIRLDNSSTSSGAPNKDGNQLFDMITSSNLTVAAICTGEPGIVELKEHQQSLAKVFEKGDGVVDQILNWLDDKANMISAIQSMQLSLKKEMATAFSKSIWPRWDYWFNEADGDYSLIESALRRHMATHLHATFLNEVTAVHPEEYYFIPPLVGKLDTGDITIVDGKHYILVTPRCEIAQGKNSTFQFVELESISSVLDKFNLNRAESMEAIVKLNDALRKNSETVDDKETEIKFNEKLEVEAKKVNSAENKISNLFRHGGNKASLHFLPEIKRTDSDNFGPFHARFDRMVFIEKSKQALLEHYLNGKYASLSNEFVPSLVERLGAYFSRIGTPDYSHPE
jgi:hypothetical protein